MRHLERAFIITIFVFSLSIIGRAQVLTKYDFLEINVVDSNGKPVEDAAVETPNDFDRKENNIYKRTTDASGKTGIGLRQSDSRFSVFKISKQGYFDFNDLGGYQNLSGNVVELLKIPQTSEEKRTLGDEQRKREFAWAVETGDVQTVSDLLKNGISPNLKTSDLRGIPKRTADAPAIMLAAAAGSGEVIKVLLGAGVKINPKTEPYKNILETYLWAGPFVFRREPENEAEKKEILRSYNEGFETLARASAVFNSKNQPEYSINVAAGEGYYGAVKVLLDEGLSANYKSGDDATILMKAARYTLTPYHPRVPSKSETVKLLLKAGADPNVVRYFSSTECETALMDAARGDVESMRALVDAGAKINFRCASGDAALSEAVENGNAKAVKYLLDKGADVKIFGRNGEIILPAAAQKDYPEMVRMLIDAGFPIDGKDNYGATALIIAINNDLGNHNEEITEMLLAAGANVNAVAGSGRLKSDCETPLMAATRRGKIDVIKALTDKKADVKFTCRDGRSVLTEAIASREPLETLKFLIEIGADVKGRQGHFALEYVKTLKGVTNLDATDFEEIRKLLEAAGAK